MEVVQDGPKGEVFGTRPVGEVVYSTRTYPQYCNKTHGVLRDKKQQQLTGHRSYGHKVYKNRKTIIQCTLIFSSGTIRLNLVGHPINIQIRQHWLYCQRHLLPNDILSFIGLFRIINPSNVVHVSIPSITSNITIYGKNTVSFMNGLTVETFELLVRYTDDSNVKIPFVNISRSYSYT